MRRTFKIAHKMPETQIRNTRGKVYEYDSTKFGHQSVKDRIKVNVEHPFKALLESRAIRKLKESSRIDDSDDESNEDIFKPRAAPKPKSVKTKKPNARIDDSDDESSLDIWKPRAAPKPKSAKTKKNAPVDSDDDENRSGPSRAKPRKLRKSRNVCPIFTDDSEDDEENSTNPIIDLDSESDSGPSEAKKQKLTEGLKTVKTHWNRKFIFYTFNVQSFINYFLS